MDFQPLLIMHILRTDTLDRKKEDTVTIVYEPI